MEVITWCHKRPSLGGFSQTFAQTCMGMGEREMLKRQKGVLDKSTGFGVRENWI